MTVNSNQPPPLAVAFYAKSYNEKLGPVVKLERADGERPSFKAVPPFVAHTYLPIAQLCDSSCPLKDRGCFAQASVATRRIVQELEQTMRAEGYSCDEVIEQEAAEIRRHARAGIASDDGAGGKRDLRLHTSGDVRTAKHARVLAEAADAWAAAGGGSVFTFTHAWRWIPVDAWGQIAVRASCETEEDVGLARERGYAVALVTDFFPNNAATYPLPSGDLVRPCPAEAKGPTTCVECRYCVDGHRLAAIPIIAFEAHGRGARAVRDTLYGLGLKRRTG